MTLRASQRVMPLSLFFTMLILPFSVAVAAAAAGTHTVAIGCAKTTLLSGGIRDCLARPSTFTGGLASSLAAFRNYTAAVGAAGHLSEYLHFLDRESAFVELHPNANGVNLDVMRAFGIHKYWSIAPHYRVSNVARSKPFFVEDIKAINSNVQLFSFSDEWSPYVLREALVANGTVGVIVLTNALDGGSLPSAAVVPPAVRRLRRLVNAVVVVNEDTSMPSSARQAQLLASGAAPDVFLDLTANSQSGTCVKSASSPVAPIGMWSCVGSQMATVLNALTLTLNTTGHVQAAAVYVPSIAGPLPATLRDATYYQHQAFLLREANRAVVHDPVLTTTTQAFPVGRNDTYCGCCAGECPQATLLARGVLAAIPEADLALQHTNGIRGDGFPAGPMRASEVWEMCPFASSLCVLKLQGLRIHELLQYSLRWATFSTDITVAGNRFLHAANLRVHYDPLAADPVHRLLSIEVFDKASGAFIPLERNRIYTVASNTYFCTTHADYHSQLLNLDRGESINTTVSSDLLQTHVTAYASTVNPYTNAYRNWLVVGRAAAMNWNQTAATCTSRQFWDAGIRSCVACLGDAVQAPGGTSCMEPLGAAENRTLLIAIAASVGGVLLVAVVTAVVCCEVRRRKSARNIETAPTGGDITVVFTDIQWSTLLWGTVPASMAVALEQHHRVIRECIGAAGAYEVKTVGDSFMVACKSAAVGVRLALAIQERLLTQAWPAAIDALYAAGKVDTTTQDHIRDDPDRTVTCDEGAPFCGLRVRIGVSTGDIVCVYDDVAKGYDYYGPGVNLASRIESVAHGGQILISRRTAADLPALGVHLFALAQLPGLPGNTELLMVTPEGPSFEARQRQLREKSVFAATSDDIVPTADAACSRNGSFVGSDAVMAMQRSALSSGAADPYAESVRAAFTAALRTVQMKDATMILAALQQAWRVPSEPDAAASATTTKELLAIMETPLHQLATRIGHVLKRMDGTTHRSLQRSTDYSRRSSDAGGNSDSRPRSSAPGSVSMSRFLNTTPHRHEHLLQQRPISLDDTCTFPSHFPSPNAPLELDIHLGDPLQGPQRIISSPSFDAIA